MSESRTTEPNPRLLVVEDDPDIGSLLEYVLGIEGFRVYRAATGQGALDAFDRQRPDLVVLDLMLPDMSGLDILQRFRANGDTFPRIIILSAKQDEADRLTGLELGADDYMVKPFSPKELVLRIRKALHAQPAVTEKAVTRLTAGPIHIDLDQHQVRVSGESVHLTLTEFRLLASIMRNRGKVRSRPALMSEIWDSDTQATSRTIDTHMRRLRAKLGPAAGWIATVRGVGYRIKPPKD